MANNEIFSEKDIQWTLRLFHLAQSLFFLVSLFCAYKYISSLNPYLSGALVYFGTLAMVLIFLLAAVKKALTHHKPFGWRLAATTSLLFVLTPLLPVALLSLKQLVNKENQEKYHQHKTAYSDKKISPMQNVIFFMFVVICLVGSYFYYDFQKDGTYFDVAFRRTDYNLPPNLSVRELYALGAECNTYGKTHCSIAVFVQILQKRPGDQRALANLAMAQSHLGQHTFAVANFQKITLQEIITFDVNLHYGNSLKATGHEEQAIIAYKKVIDKNPYFIEAAAKITLILISKKKYTQALEFVEDYLIKNPNAEKRLESVRKELQDLLRAYPKTSRWRRKEEAVQLVPQRRDNKEIEVLG